MNIWLRCLRRRLHRCDEHKCLCTCSHVHTNVSSCGQRIRKPLPSDNYAGAGICKCFKFKCAYLGRLIHP